MANRGLEGASAPLPHLPTIQDAFRPHDLSNVRVAVGGPARDAARNLGANAFTAGERIGFRETPSLQLAAHEAAHVVQQRAGVALPGGIGRADDVHERGAAAVANAVASGRPAGALLQAPAAPCACGTCESCTARVQLDTGTPATEADDVAEQHQKLIADKSQEIEDIETGTGKYTFNDQATMIGDRARATRELAVLVAANPQTYEDLAELDDRVGVAAKGESATIAAIRPANAKAEDTDESWSNDFSWGFPETWADRLSKSLRPLFDVEEARRDRERAWDRVTDSGKDVPAYLVEHGLPVAFDQAYELDHFYMSPMYQGLPSSNPLGAFAQAMAGYQGAYAHEILAKRYAAAIDNLVASVRSGQDRIDASVFPQFAHDRSWQPTPADLFRDAPHNPFAADRINPYDWERQSYQVLSAVSVLDMLVAGNQARDEFNRLLDQADALLAAKSGAERLYIAHLWASEHGYYAFVRDVIWKGIKQHFPDIAKDALVETGKFFLIQWIPVVNMLYDAYLIGKAAYHAIDAAWTLSEAEDAAKDAKTIIGLQRATARLALAENTEALKLVAAALEAFGGWSAMRGAMEKTAAAFADDATASTANAARSAARATASGAERAVAGTAKEATIAGERHVLTVIEQLGRMFIRMCSPTCGELVDKLRRLLVFLEDAGADTFAKDPVARLLEKGMKLERRLASMAQEDAEKELGKLAQSVEELSSKHPDIAKALPEIEGMTAGQPTLYPNLEPRRLGAELAEAAKLGVKPLRVGDAGFDAAFDAMANEGTIKFVITRSGELVMMPKFVGGQEISHSVLSEGRAVLAAGEADIASVGGTRFGSIEMHSGHFKPDLSTEGLARDAFTKIGVTIR